MCGVWCVVSFKRATLRINARSPRPPLFPLSQDNSPRGGSPHALPPGVTCGTPENPTLTKKHERRQLANHDTIMAGQPGINRGRSSRTRRRSGRKKPRNAPTEFRQRLSTGKHQYQYQYPIPIPWYPNIFSSQTCFFFSSAVSCQLVV